MTECTFLNFYYTPNRKNVYLQFLLLGKIFVLRFKLGFLQFTCYIKKFHSYKDNDGAQVFFLYKI
jgi:hypothetical protein